MKICGNGEKAMAGGGGSCDAMLAQLREKHQVKETTALPAKSTVGIVLDGTVVNIVVPGSPGCRPNGNGERIHPGDVIFAIDGNEVTKTDIIPNLRGNDSPGSSVKITVLKRSLSDPGQHRKIDFTLTRADMRSVMSIRDLYMAIGELHKEMDNPRPEQLKQKIEVLEQRVLAVTSFNDEHLKHLQAHVVDLETSVRTLYVQNGAPDVQIDAFEPAKHAFDSLKTEHVALLEECNKLRQKLNASAKGASSRVDMDQQLQKSQEMCEQLHKEASQAKKDASLLKARAEGAEKQLQQAEQDLKIANAKQQQADVQILMLKTEHLALLEECDKLKRKLNTCANDASLRDMDMMKKKARLRDVDQQLQKAQEMCEQLRKEASQARNDASLLKARAQGAETKLAEQDRFKPGITEEILLKGRQEMCELLLKEASQAKSDAKVLKARAESAEIKLLQAGFAEQDRLNQRQQCDTISVSTVTPRTPKASCRNRASSSSPFSVCNGHGSSTDSPTLCSTLPTSARARAPRAESAVGEETSSLGVGEPYDNDLLGPGSSRVMQILYQEREEKRRLLNLMRKAAAHA